MLNRQYLEVELGRRREEGVSGLASDSFERLKSGAMDK
jgi:hypothetical protein